MQRVEPNSLVFKLGVFVFVAMFAILPLTYLLPVLALLLPSEPAAQRAGLLLAMFTLLFLLFALFLCAARLLLCTMKELALLFAVDGAIVLALYAARLDRGEDQLLLTWVLIPMLIATSYYVYCDLRKLI